jgi:two-component system, NarL family, response regulator LiaR
MTTQSPSIRILIVDDHTIVRRGIKALLAEMDDMQVVGEADNGLEAVCLSKQLEPDVILMDLLMPKMDGMEATRQIIGQQPHMRVLVMTSFVHDEKIAPAIRAGAAGYVLKETEPEELIRSIYKVYRGQYALDPGMARKLTNDGSEITSGLVSISETSAALEAQHRSFPAVLSVRRKYTAHQPKLTF